MEDVLELFAKPESVTAAKFVERNPLGMSELGYTVRSRAIAFSFVVFLAHAGVCIESFRSVGSSSYAGQGPAALKVRLRGGAFGRAETVFERAKALSDPDEFYREFGTGPGLELSASAFEIKPDSFNDTDSLMDGMGMWDYPEEMRLVGEHHAAKVGHRVRTSKYLKESFAAYNWTDFVDGWDHQNDRLGTVVGITDDGRLCEVQWDDQDGLPGSIDWYATGYLNNFFLSLAEEPLQPVFEDDEKLLRIQALEAELAKLKEED